MRIAIIGVVAALMLSTAQAESLSGHAGDSEVGFAAATLAPAGSFEFKAAPAYTQLIMKRHRAEYLLKYGQISKSFAISVQTRADAVRKLLDQAIVACKQDDKTGKCTNDPKTANALLRSAKAQLAQIK